MYKYTFSDLVITSYQNSGADQSQGEQLTLAYERIKWEYLHDEFEFIPQYSGNEVTDRGFTWIEIKRPPDPKNVTDDPNADLGLDTIEIEEIVTLAIDDVFIL